MWNDLEIFATLKSRGRSKSTIENCANINVFFLYSWDSSNFEVSTNISWHEHRNYCVLLLKIIHGLLRLFQAFKERLFDSSLSEKYETLQVDNTPYNNRRYRSISPRGFDDEFDDDDDDDPYHTEDSPNSRKRLLFLQDPLARSMYRNLETFFDRKNLIRDFTSAGGGGDYITSGGAPGGLTSRSSNHHNQSHFTSSAQDYQPMESRAQSSMDFRSSSAMGMNSTARSLDPPRSQSSMDNRGGGSTSGSFFGRRKREQPVSQWSFHQAL